MRPSLATATALVAVCLAGCAADPQATPSQAPQELTYRTGSNIPIREKVVVTQEEKDRQAQDLRNLQQQILPRGGSTGK